MAYRSFDEDSCFDVMAETASPIGAAFTPIEWAVIGIARRDGIATVHRPSRLGTVLRRIFGLPAKNGLADPRLEALRQFAVRRWHGGAAIAQAEIEAFLSTGFTVAQMMLLTRGADRRSGDRRQYPKAAGGEMTVRLLRS